MGCLSTCVATPRGIPKQAAAGQCYVTATAHICHHHGYRGATEQRLRGYELCRSRVQYLRGYMFSPCVFTVQSAAGFHIRM